MRREDNPISGISEISEKRHNTAETSREAFTDLVNTGRLIDEKRLCFEAIKKYGPITSRRLAEVTGRERTNITRSLYDLENEMIPSIKVAFIAPCYITKRKVKHYAVIDWKPGLFDRI